MEIFNDGYFRAETDYHEFVKFLAERRNTQVLYAVSDVGTLRLLPSDDLDVMFGVGQELRDDTDTSGTGLYWQTDDGTVIPSRDTAVSQALNQLGCRGQFLERLGREGLADLMNGYVFPYAKGGKRLFVEDGKVSGFVSGTDFTEIPACEVMEAVMQYMTATFPDAEFKGGTFTHEYTWGTWSLERHKDRFRALDGTDYVPQFTVVTSDCGLSSVTVRPYMRGGNISFPVSPLRVQHRGNAGIDDVRTELEKAYAMVMKTVEDLEGLKNIMVDNPVSTLKRVMKAEKLPKREALTAVEQFRQMNGDGPCTAYDCFRAVCEVLQMLPADMTAEQKFRAEDNVCRCMAVKWHDYDLPGDFSW